MSIASHGNVGQRYRDGSKSIVPVWKKDHFQTKPFLERFEQLMEADNVDPAVWTRLLLKAVTDVNEAKWVRNHIIKKGLSWKDSKEAFALRFDLFSHKDTQESEFYRIKQRPNESVQEYSQRFLSLASEIGEDTDSKSVRNIFFNGLRAEAKAEYRKRMAIVAIANPEKAALIQEDLDQMIVTLVNAARDDYLLTGFRALSTSSESRSAPSHHVSSGGGQRSLANPPSSSGGARRGPTNGKVCSLHGKMGHSTAECRTLAANASHASSPAKPPVSSNSSVSSGGGASSVSSPFRDQSSPKPPRVCFSCQSPDHIATDPKCPKFNVRGTRGNGLPLFPASAASAALRSLQVSAETSLSTDANADSSEYDPLDQGGPE
jgi:hypothetical protein